MFLINLFNRHFKRCLYCVSFLLPVIGHVNLAKSQNLTGSIGENYTFLVFRLLSGLALWCSWLSLCLQCQHPVWALVQVLPVPLLIQFPADIPGKAAEPATHRRDLDKFSLLLASTWPSPGHLGINQQMEAFSLSVSPSNCNFAFQICFSN